MFSCKQTIKRKPRRRLPSAFSIGSQLSDSPRRVTTEVDAMERLFGETSRHNTSFPRSITGHHRAIRFDGRFDRSRPLTGIINSVYLLGNDYVLRVPRNHPRTSIRHGVKRLRYPRRERLTSRLPIWSGSITPSICCRSLSDHRTRARGDPWPPGW